MLTGTTKRKQYYQKRIACPLLGAPQPVTDEKNVVEGSCWLYRCNMRLRRPVSVEQNPRGRRIHAPDETPRHFGLITRHRMPLVRINTFVFSLNKSVLKHSKHRAGNVLLV